MKGFEFYVGCNDGEEPTRQYDPQGVKRFIIKSLLLCGIDGATLQTIEGMWKGKLETTIKVMVAVDENMKDGLLRACQMVREAFRQQAVMLVEKQDSYSFV